MSRGRTWWIVLLLCCCACSGTTKAEREQAADIVGTPPGPDEDPFFYVARPPPDTKAEKRGTIGDGATKSDTKKPTEKKHKATKTAAASSAATSRETEKLRQENALALAARDDAEARALELRAKNAQLQNELEVARATAKQLEKAAPKVSKSDLEQCHSCVKLCPLRGRCAKDAELICGWGTGKRKKDAMLRATTECDGALDSLKARGVYSLIEGNCPVAACSDE